MLRSALNQAVAPGSDQGTKISGSELDKMKKTAAGGTLPLVDINALRTEAMGEGGAAGAEKLRALDELAQVAGKTAQAQSKATMGVLETIDTLNPFAWVRWGLGGSKPGMGSW